MVAQSVALILFGIEDEYEDEDEVMQIFSAIVLVLEDDIFMIDYGVMLRNK